MIYTSEMDKRRPVEEGVTGTRGARKMIDVLIAISPMFFSDGILTSKHGKGSTNIKDKRHSENVNASGRNE